MSLSKEQVKFLRAKCHDLKPVILLGQKGLTDAVVAELDNALEHHELVKIKLSVEDRDDRRQMIDEILQRSHAEQIQSIGKTVSIYRRNEEKPVIELPSG